MIIEYNRPTALENALLLLARKEPMTVPLGGGSVVNRPSPLSLAVVDLQDLGLNYFRAVGNTLELGATLNLQMLLNHLYTSDNVHYSFADSLKKAISHEATYNLRQVGTIAGRLVSASGRSPFALVMLALDALLYIQPQDQKVWLGDLMPQRKEKLRNALITQVSIPSNARLCYEYVARSPADQPIVAVAVSIWPSRRTRVALGGYGSAPIMVFDGPEAEGSEIAARSAYNQAGDSWASAEYRQEMVGMLTKRCLEQLESVSNHRSD